MGACVLFYASADALLYVLIAQAGQVGMYGYSQYSATKFALRGLAEVLSMEVCRMLRVVGWNGLRLFALAVLNAASRVFISCLRFIVGCY